MHRLLKALPCRSKEAGYYVTHSGGYWARFIFNRALIHPRANALKHISYVSLMVWLSARKVVNNLSQNVVVSKHSRLRDDQGFVHFLKEVIINQGFILRDCCRARLSRFSRKPLQSSHRKITK